MWRLVSVVVEQNGIDKVLTVVMYWSPQGRHPNTEGLGPGTDRVELTDRGYIKVNERRRPPRPFWAIGEVAGRPAVHALRHRRFRVVPCNEALLAAWIPITDGTGRASHTFQLSAASFRRTLMDELRIDVNGVSAALRNG